VRRPLASVYIPCELLFANGKLIKKSLQKIWILRLTQLVLSVNQVSTCFIRITFCLSQKTINHFTDMPFARILRKIAQFDQLIRQGRTGNYQKIAARLEISKSTLYELIDMMRDMGAPIEYDSLRQSYVYTEEGKL
jgi:hypothetical protein